MNLKLIDCTLRDGGYYNNWKFDSSFINKYLSSIIKSNIDIVEIGFRFISPNNDFGDLAYSTDKYLSQFSVAGEIDFAVMINAKDFIYSDLGVESALHLSFNNKSKSIVDIVRIATHVNDIDECKLIANVLRKLGYRVFLNLMQIDSIKLNVLSDAANKIKKWNSIEVLYFADSFGNLDAYSIDNIVKTIKSIWDGDMGIHAHDNKGHALINSLSAIDSGVNYVDATILGMGRGAGNTKMENLLVEISDKGVGEYNPDAIFPLVLKEFAQLQAQYKWGSSIYYYLSAVHGVHPTYIQEMLSDGRYDTEQILSAISFLKDNAPSSYSLENMMEALSNSIGSEYGSWSAKDWAKDREVLVIGSGPSTILHIAEISKYIKKNQPIVLCLNINQDVPENLVTAYITCHETRIAIELDLYADLAKPIVLPMSRMPSEISGFLSNVDILDYGLKIEKGNFFAQDNGCILDKPLVLMYALSLLSVSGVKKISLTGVDGYKENNPKQQEMTNSLNQFMRYNQHLDLCAITPTTYPISQELII
jgi:4-hydroxy 2-oxovalerate aldolase